MKSKMIRNLFLIFAGISVLLLGSCSGNSIPKKSSGDFSQYEYAVSFYSYRPKTLPFLCIIPILFFRFHYT